MIVFLLLLYIITVGFSIMIIPKMIVKRLLAYS